jgi:PAS domain-containing protein
MSSTVGGSTSELRARIAELEQQLASAERVDGAHTETETSLRDALAYSESIVDTVREPMLVLDGTLRIKTASRAFYQTFGLSPEETVGQFLYDLGQGQWNVPALRMLKKCCHRRRHFVILK